MASFASNGPTRFDPYISQLPIVSAMTEIGMEKQAKYDQGIQRIQTQIDNVAGMDVMRDIDKQYLQSKMGELGNNLKYVAAGDFSNYQLTNSVGGMVNQIGKDENIQNAVYSTQQVRKGQRDLQTAKSTGKSSIQNEDYWNTQVGSWLNNKELGKTFRGEYVPYTDLTEKYAKVDAALKDTEYSYDQPYQTNADGSVKYFDAKGNQTTADKGQPIIDDAMKSITKKGKSAKRILDNFYSNTTENDQQQLAIDATYHYKNASFDTFKNDIVANFALQKKQLNDYTTELAVTLKNPNISTKDKTTIQAQLNDVNERLNSGKAEQELSSSLKELQNPRNLEVYKVKLYTQKYLSNLAQDKSTESYKEELKSNPYAQMNMEKKKFQFDIQKENTRINQWNATYALDIQKWQTERADKAMAAEEKRKEKLGSEPVTTSGGVRTDIEAPTSLSVTDSINANDVELKQRDNEFLSQNSKYKKADLDALADEYSKNPGNVDVKDNDLRSYLDNRHRLENSNARSQNLLTQMSKVTAPIEAKLDAAFAGTRGLVDSNTGKEVYTAKELFEVGKVLDGFSADLPMNMSNMRGEDIANIISKNNEKVLARYAGSKYENLAKTFVKRSIGQPLNSIEQSAMNRMQQINSQFTNVASNTVKDKLDAESNYLITKDPKYMTMEGTLDIYNKPDMVQVSAIIAKSMIPSVGGLDVNSNSDFNAETLNTWRNNPKIKDLQYRISKNYDGSANLVVQNGTEKQTIPMTASDFTAFFPRYAEVSAMTAIKRDILSSPESTTNPLGREKPTSAAYTGYNLPMLKDTNIASKVRYDIEGAKSNSGGPMDGYQVRVYVNDGKMWHQGVVNQRGYIGEEQIQDVISRIGMDVVQSILKQ